VVKTRFLEGFREVDFGIYQTRRSPLTPLKKGGTGSVLKVPLPKGDLGGSRLSIKPGDPLAQRGRARGHRPYKAGIGSVLKVPLFKGDLGGSRLGVKRDLQGLQS